MCAAVRWTRVAGTVAAPETLTVAARDGHVVGFCHGGLGRSAVAEAVGGDEPVAEIYALYVDPSFQGFGVGRALLAAVARRLIPHGFASLALLPLARPFPCRLFYAPLLPASPDPLPPFLFSYLMPLLSGHLFSFLFILFFFLFFI